MAIGSPNEWYLLKRLFNSAGRLEKELLERGCYFYVFSFSAWLLTYDEML